MNNSENIKKLAYLRLEEAKILAEHKKYDGAYYLAGYSLELMLKAKVCDHLDIDDLFDEQCQMYGISEVRKALKTHDITVLLLFSGLKNKFESEKSRNRGFMTATASLFDVKGKCLWSEQLRYHIGKSENQVRDFIETLDGEQGLIKWIEQN